MYHSPVTGTYYEFVTDRGHTDEYELSGATGNVTGRLVRQLQLIPNATEGLVADDELARVYVAEEDIGGIWRFGAEPADATTGVRIDTTTEVGGHIVQDVKGLALAYAGGRGGFLVAASQGGDSFHVYDRGDNTWRGEFQIADGPLTDKVTAIDGIDVSSFALGPRFPFGVFVSQDDVNPGAAGDVRFAGFGSPSVLPARIWQLRGEALAEATPRFGRYLAAGATRLYARSRAAARSGRRRFARGVLAAAVAQDYAAGQAPRADRRVAAALARGDLRPQRGEPRSAGGGAYVRRLHALLARVGYAS